MSKRSRSKTRTSSKLSRPTRWLLALVLLPLLWGMVHQTCLVVPLFFQGGFQGWGLYVAGMLSYVLIERLLTKPMWLYVFGHELTHALTGLLSGAKVHSFKAKSTGGEVHLSKSNAFIALSPYVIPLYAVGVMGIYAVTRHWWNPPQLVPVFQYTLGMALAFHISLTFSAIHRHQPDLKVLGLFLSGILIVLGNLLIFDVIGLVLFSNMPSFSSFAHAVGRDTGEAWETIFDLTLKAGKWGLQYMESKHWIQ